MEESVNKNYSLQEDEFETIINCAATCKAYGPSQFLRRDILHFRLLKKKLGKAKSSALIRIRAEFIPHSVRNQDFIAVPLVGNSSLVLCR